MREPQFLFGGPPVWMVNLPYFLVQALGGTALVVVGYLAALIGISAAWPVVSVCLGMLGLTVLFRLIETRLQVLVVDSERMTYRRGIFTRVTGSVELYRIQTVECTSMLWERMLGFGTLVVYSSDANHPYWEIPGIRRVDEKRFLLNRAAIALRDARGIREINMGRV
jgi:membrane protein YdbS with pleckstrin-like domain